MQYDIVSSNRSFDSVVTREVTKYSEVVVNGYQVDETKESGWDVVKTFLDDLDQVPFVAQQYEVKKEEVPVYSVYLARADVDVMVKTAYAAMYHQKREVDVAEWNNHIRCIMNAKTRNAVFIYGTSAQQNEAELTHTVDMRRNLKGLMSIVKGHLFIVR